MCKQNLAWVVIRLRLQPGIGESSNKRTSKSWMCGPVWCWAVFCRCWSAIISSSPSNSKLQDSIAAKVAAQTLLCKVERTPINRDQVTTAAVYISSNLVCLNFSMRLFNSQASSVGCAHPFAIMIPLSHLDIACRMNDTGSGQHRSFDLYSQ